MISPLLTDLYQLTMAYGYWKLGMHDREAVFHLIFRKQPFASHYAVACGLATAIEFLQNWRFCDDDIAYLQGLQTPAGTPLFSEAFLSYLKELRFTCDIDAIPEGNVVFPHEPLIRVSGPLIQGQLIESTLLNLINFQTLIATKAARVCQAAKGDAVLEFGLRRAQGPEGALLASRAAFVGGCASTSNVLAGKRYGIPVAGTHAHSWVTAFDDEVSAFLAYAKVMPENCILLVDTYDTIQGVKNAIAIGQALREQGMMLRGVRLDSGDLAELAVKARQLLDEAGLTETAIIASNSLDEYVIEALKSQGTAITVWGVGTNLVTAYDHPALDGVYKLSALRDANGNWQHKIKLSEQAVKVSNPGRHQVRRLVRDGRAVMDVIYDLDLGIPALPEMVSLNAPHTSLAFDQYDDAIDMLQPIFRQGELVYAQESIASIRERAKQELHHFLTTHDDVPYPVGLELELHQTKQQLIKDISKRNNKKLYD